MVLFLPLLILEQLEQSPEGAQAAEHLTAALSQVLSRVVLVASFTAKAVGLAMVLYWGYTVLQTAISSPYSVSSVGVHGRALPVEAIDLGDHDDAECLTCGREEGLGVRRGYVNEHVVFGLPVLEKNREETYDCVAHTDRKGLDALDQDDRDALDLALEQSDADETDTDSPEEEIGEEAGDAR
jgi:hypothetical protein